MSVVKLCLEKNHPQVTEAETTQGKEPPATPPQTSRQPSRDANDDTPEETAPNMPVALGSPMAELPTPPLSTATLEEALPSFNVTGPTPKKSVPPDLFKAGSSSEDDLGKCLCLKECRTCADDHYRFGR